ncbi:MAG: hypothetical protein ACLFP0_12150 [Rhodosalinus sp.]
MARRDPPQLPADRRDAPRTRGARFFRAVGSVPGLLWRVLRRAAILALGLGILAVLAAPSIDRDEPIEVWLAAVTGLSVLLAVVGGAFLWTAVVLPSATALLVAFALIAYGVHRYEIVRIGLVTNGDTA